MKEISAISMVFNGYYIICEMLDNKEITEADDVWESELGKIMIGEKSEKEELEKKYNIKYKFIGMVIDVLDSFDPVDIDWYPEADEYV